MGTKLLLLGDGVKEVIGKNDTINRFLFTVFDSIYGQFVVYLTVSADCW